MGGKVKMGKRVAAVSGQALMAKVANLMKSGVVPKPLWYDAAKMVNFEEFS